MSQILWYSRHRLIGIWIFLSLAASLLHASEPDERVKNARARLSKAVTNSADASKAKKALAEIFRRFKHLLQQDRAEEKDSASFEAFDKSMELFSKKFEKTIQSTKEQHLAPDDQLQVIPSDGFDLVSYDPDEYRNSLAVLEAFTSESTNSNGSQEKNSSEEDNPQDQEPRFAMVTTQGAELRVRSRPDGDIVSSLANGSTIKILGEEDGWYEIEFGDATAYVKMEYVSIIAEEEEEISHIPPVSAGPRGNGSKAGAVNWAYDQLEGGHLDGSRKQNDVTLTTKDTWTYTKDDGTEVTMQTWDNYCLSFVSTAYGDQWSELATSTAYGAYENCLNAGLIRTDRNPPAGAVIFQGKINSNPFGHICIATGEKDESGDPILITTGWPGFHGIHRITLGQLEAKSSANYLGWALPDNTPILHVDSLDDRQKPQ